MATLGAADGRKYVPTMQGFRAAAVVIYQIEFNETKAQAEQKVGDPINMSETTLTDVGMGLLKSCDETDQSRASEIVKLWKKSPVRARAYYLGR